MFWCDEHFDTSRGAGLTADESQVFEGEDHLVDGGRRDLKVPPQIGFGGRPAVDAAIGVDEGQVLPLGGCEAGLAAAEFSSEF